MARNDHSITRAQRLRDLAAGADNIANLAGILDDTLARARLDLLVLAGAARALAGKLDHEADASEVAP